MAIVKGSDRVGLAIARAMGLHETHLYALTIRFVAGELVMAEAEYFVTPEACDAMEAELQTLVFEEKRETET